MKKFFERDLEDIIFNTPNTFLRKRGLPIFGKKFRQVNLGNYGVADLITIQRNPPNSYLSTAEPVNFMVTIFELKRDKIDHSSFWQSLRYLTGCIDYESKRNSTRHFPFVVDYRIILIGADLDMESAFPYLPHLGPVKLFTYDYKVDGILFNPHNRCALTQSGF